LGGVFKSIDKGQSWTQILTAASTVGVCCSSDGSHVYCQNSSLFYTSTNSGASFSSQASPIIVTSLIACSPDGTTIMLAGSSTLAMSHDYGANWATQYSVISAIKACAGGVCYYIGDNTGMGMTNLYRSGDSGQSFGAIYNTGITAGDTLDASTDGTIVYASGGGNLLKSTDSGTSFNSIHSAGIGVACSGNGQTVLLKNNNSAINYSSDGGVTWGASNVGTSGYIAISSDGSIASVGNFLVSKSSVPSKSFACLLSGAIKRDTGASTTVIVGVVQKNALSDTPTGWDVNATADATNGAISFTATGEASTTVLWKCNVTTV
jgi:hypothetical protein